MDAQVEAEATDPSKQARKDWTKSTEQTEEDKKLMEEWEQHMHDFVPEDITTVIVEPRREVVSQLALNYSLDLLRGHQG